MACSSPLRAYFENLGDIGDHTFPASYFEGLIAFLPRLSEKTSTGKNGFVGCVSWAGCLTSGIMIVSLSWDRRGDWVIGGN